MESMLGQLDDYSSYIRPADLQQFHEVIDQEFGGVGMEVGLDAKTKQLLVLCPLVNSPAYVAGIRAGDHILRIDGAATQGMSLKDAVGLMRGVPAAALHFWCFTRAKRAPWRCESFARSFPWTPFWATRETPTARGTFPSQAGPHRLRAHHQLRRKDGRRIGARVKWLKEHDMRGLVLDLRDDPGGLLGSAVESTTFRLRHDRHHAPPRRPGERGIRRQRQRDVHRFSHGRGDQRQFGHAAEIMAACPQDHHRAAIVGQRSYGKGTVQELIDLENGCGAMKLTTASYWRPNNKNIHRLRNAKDTDEWGVKPDDGCQVVVEGEELNKLRQWRISRDMYKPDGAPKEPLQPVADRQLARAVQAVEKQPAAASSAAKQP